MPKKSWVTWQIILASSRARKTSQMFPIRRVFLVWNFPLQVGEHIPREMEVWVMWMIFGDVDSKVLEVASPFAFIQLIPTFLQPTTNSLGASTSLRRCIPLSLPDFYLSWQPLFILDGWFGHWTSALVICNFDCWINKRLWRLKQVCSMVFGYVFNGNIEVTCGFS